MMNHPLKIPFQTDCLQVLEKDILGMGTAGRDRMGAYQATSLTTAGGGVDSTSGQTAMWEACYAKPSSLGFPQALPGLQVGKAGWAQAKRLI